MNLQKIISKNSFYLVFLILILLRFSLINLNSAEWGDSYRILRAAEISRNDFYPQDEKRPPLFSLILALRPDSFDPIDFARIIMFVVYVINLVIFAALVKAQVRQNKYKILALVIFGLNPVYLYWSLRIYADTFFLSFVLLISYYWCLWNKDLKPFRVILLGVIAGFSILVRFEGYILAGSVLLAILFRDFSLYRYLSITRNIKSAIIYGGTLTLIAFPYMVYRNPLNSTYLAEPSGRTYDLTTVLIFVASLLFSFGFLAAPAILTVSLKFLKKQYLKDGFQFFFVSLSLLLILLWPAAIPRLFVSILPFFIFWLISTMQWLETQKTKSFTLIIYSLLFTVIYIVFQINLKLQFLIVLKLVFVIILLLNITSIILIYKKLFYSFYIFQILSILLWTGSTLWIHRDIYRSISEASLYASTNLRGNIVYNDIHSVANWYLNYSPGRGRVTGEYLKVSDTSDLAFSELDERKTAYVIITNEGDRSLNINDEKLPYLDEIREFSYNVNGAVFFTKVYRFDNHYRE